MSAGGNELCLSRPWIGTRLWNRQLDSYPDTARRFFSSGITVLCTVTLYYELYVTASVSTLLLVKLHMSFTFFVYSRAVASLIGAFGSLFGGIADRVGRTNLVVAGLLVTGVMVAFVHPTVDRQMGIHPLQLPRVPGRGRLSGRHPGADPGLLAAGGSSEGDGPLDERPGGRKPGRVCRGQPHHRCEPQSGLLGARVQALRDRRLGCIRNRCHRRRPAVRIAPPCPTTAWIGLSSRAPKVGARSASRKRIARYRATTILSRPS